MTPRRHVLRPKHVRPFVAIASLCLSVACGGGGSATVVSPDGGAGKPTADGGSTTRSVDDGAIDARHDASKVDGRASQRDSGAPGDHDDAHADGAYDAGPTDANTPDGGLDPDVAPGGNFDLSLWELQEPVGSPGAPTTILPAQLEGPNGYHDTYFFTDPTDGSMTFWDPEDGVTTANSSYPRSELREMTASGAAANWLATSGTNTLRATLASTLIPDHVAVGQIHLGTGTPASTKPLLELFYYATGSIVLAIEQTPAGGNEVPSTVGNVPLGTKWSYVIELSGNTITAVINGGAAQTFAMDASFDQENMYFKAGDYDQSVGTSSTVGAKVQFYALRVTHGP